MQNIFARSETNSAFSSCFFFVAAVVFVSFIYVLDASFFPTQRKCKKYKKKTLKNCIEKLFVFNLKCLMHFNSTWTFHLMEHKNETKTFPYDLSIFMKKF